MEISWKPAHLDPGEPRRDWPDSVFAFPKQRKEPLTDAAHVRSAAARFNQVEGVSQHDRHLAIDNIRAAAKYYGIGAAADSIQER